MTYSYNPLASLGLDKSIPLDGSGKIPSDYLPSYVDDVVEYDDLASFPVSGETGKIYVAKDTGYTYRWTGSVYVRIGSGGEVELNLGLEDSPSLYFSDDTNTGLYSPGADQVAISTNGTERVEFGTSEVVFNDGGENYDFRIEGDTASNLFFVDASANAVGIGTSSPSSLFHAYGSANNSIARVENTDTTNGYGFFVKGGGTTSGRYVASFQDAAGNTRLHILSSGNVGIGTTNVDELLHVESDGATPKIKVESTLADSSPGFRVTNDARSYDIRIDGTNDNLQFYDATASQGRVAIDSSGRLLVGTVSGSDLNSSANANFVTSGTGVKGGIALTHYDTSASSEPILALRRSGSSSIGTYTALGNARRIGNLSFYGTDGTGFSEGAEIRAETEDIWATGDTPARLVFSTNPGSPATAPVERMRIDSDGVVTVAPVNTAGDTPYIHVFDGRSSQNVGYVASDYSGNEWHFGRSNVDGYFYVVRQTGVGMYMNTNSWVATSDQRAKQNIADIESTIDVVKALKPSRFNWKADGTADVGFIAQQVQPLIPEAVVDSGDPDAMLGITQDKLLPFVVKALQEAVTKIETLEAKVAALESA